MDLDGDFVDTHFCVDQKISGRARFYLLQYVQRTVFSCTVQHRYCADDDDDDAIDATARDDEDEQKIAPIR
jgi:hypothetical protein